MPDVNSANRLFFHAGQIIMHQGDAGDSAYIIEDGTVNIFLDTGDGVPTVVATRGNGSIIGEMALVDSKPRTATVQAVTDCRLLQITRTDFNRRVANSDPAVRLIMQIILARYREVLRQTLPSSEGGGRNQAEHVELEHPLHKDTINMYKMADNFAHAISNNELELYYQPMIDLCTKKLCGFEALMRWKNSQGIPIASPDVFIPLAEDTGLITQASIWAFESACKALILLKEVSPSTPDLFMSVNFSSEDFTTPSLLDNIINIMSRTGVSPKDIHLEITERVLISEPGQARLALEAFQAVGVSISIDDFGTGYSSLSYLHDYPIDILKIDRSFITKMTQDVKAKELIKSIVSLGHNLNMKIIAEGVETMEHVNELTELGCDVVQGYFFSKPINLPDLIKFIRSN